MSFRLPCPNCGLRPVSEFDFGGEYHRRPAVDARFEEWTRYLYLRVNSDGDQIEWWYHRMGCRLWFLASRNTSTNQVYASFWPERLTAQTATGKSSAESQD